MSALHDTSPRALASRTRHATFGPLLATGALALLAVTCGAPAPETAHGASATTAPAAGGAAAAAAAAGGPAAGATASGASAGDTSAGGVPSAAQVAASAQAWGVVYGVLQHPRCMNCHPAGDAPLQGDDSHPHAQDVRRGADGTGVHGMRCDTCHHTANLDAPHLPPGAPHWHLPKPEMPLVFEGRSARDLAAQLRDPAQNGGRTPEQLFEHMRADPLVLWGWAPGPGRTPVSTPHDQLVRAMRIWIDGGCAVPER